MQNKMHLAAIICEKNDKNSVIAKQYSEIGKPFSPKKKRLPNLSCQAASFYLIHISDFETETVVCVLNMDRASTTPTEC